MTTTQVLFERGLAVHRTELGWQLQHVVGGDGGVMADVASVVRENGLRPVVIVEDRLGTDEYSDLLTCLAPTQIYGVRVTQLQQRAYGAHLDFQQVRNINYMLVAVSYHCIELCKAYRDTCESFARLAGALLPDEDRVVTHQGSADAYFEFDALVTAVRRAYDSLRYLMWKHFGPGSGSVPSSFPKTLDRCSALPQALRQRLAASWTSWGEPVTAYRDCIQHYCPVDLGTTVMWMEKTDSGAWSTSARIPDNPSSRSRAKFTYAEKLDALTFGWESANEVLDIATLVMECAVAANDTAPPGGVGA